MTIVRLIVTVFVAHVLLECIVPFEHNVAVWTDELAERGSINETASDQQVDDRICPLVQCGVIGHLIG